MADLLTPEKVATNGRGDAGSLMASLRAKRDAIEANQHKTLDLDIPGYDGLLVASYRRVKWEVVSAISDWINESEDPRADLLGAADLLIACCDQMLTRKDDKLVPLHEAPGMDLEGQPVRYEPRLADAFGYEQSSAREIVLGLFRNEFAVIDQHRDVMRWLWESKAKADEDF